MTYSVIVVSGRPASGKSTLARQLSSSLGLPTISKDLIKEALFESLGSADRESSIQLGKASFDVLLKLAGQFQLAKVPFILESAFRANDGIAIQSAVGSAAFLQIYCHAPVEVLIERFVHRADSGSRHEGHADADNIDELRSNLHSGTYAALQLPGRLLRLDTSRFSNWLCSDHVEDIYHMYA